MHLLNEQIMKNKTIAAILAFFLGAIGIHKFYLGKTGQGVLYLVFCWTLIPAILALIDFIMLLVMSEEKFNSTYNTVDAIHQPTAQQAATTRPMQATDGALYILVGIMESLYVYEDRIVLDKNKGKHQQMLLGEGGVITFPLRNLRSLSFKEATWAINGSITFRTWGGVEYVVASSNTKKHADKTITFQNSANEVAKQIVAYLEEKINARGTKHQTTSIADEVLKFKNLLDQGAITQEEYDAKKAELLK